MSCCFVVPCNLSSKTLGDILICNKHINDVTIVGHDKNLVGHLQQIVAHVPRVRDLCLDWEGEHVQSMPVGVAPLLGQLTELETLDAWNCHFVESVEPLRALTKLTFLRIALGDGDAVDAVDAVHAQQREAGARGLEVVASLRRLNYLDLENSCITDLHPLTRLTGLTLLNLWGCPVTDLSCLRCMTTLEELGLEYVPAAATADDEFASLFNALPNLKTLRTQDITITGHPPHTSLCFDQED